MALSPFFVPVECQSKAIFQSEQDVIVVSSGDHLPDGAYRCWEGYLWASDQTVAEWEARQVPEVNMGVAA